MRVYLYILSEISSALVGWSIGQFFLSDLGWLKQFPELVLFPSVAISLAVGTVATEIFLSNPTRTKVNFRIFRLPLGIAAVLGLLIGLASGGMAEFLFMPQTRESLPIVSNWFVRIVGWLLIGGAVGIAEGFTWRWRSVEAGDTKRFLQRCLTSIVAASSAGFIAALIFEVLRPTLTNLPPEWKGIEDVVGFGLLGFLLGVVFSFSTSPSYMAALRAGAGFEYTDPNPAPPINSPTIQRVRDGRPLLKFVSNGYSEQIEEGLSIQLPVRGEITIGSGKNAAIRLPGIPLHASSLDLSSRQAILTPNKKYFDTIAVRGETLKSNNPVPLKHNDILTFYTTNQSEANGKNFFRFVYYNRFLDPEA